MIMATGAVEPTEEKLSAWFKAGVSCVGMDPNYSRKKLSRPKTGQKSANFVMMHY
jgi:2-dehydro-3-deoxyphosphogluconate aldolase/(4S)-4-hydroxy-2-oxoglutarate aldolase